MSRPLMLGPRLMFLGAPGVGKGTYAARLAAHLVLPTISTGDLVRAEVARGSSLGDVFRAASERGALVPDDAVTALVRQQLGGGAEHGAGGDATAAAPRWGGRDGRGGHDWGEGGGRGYLLDGFPRTVAQARAFDESHGFDLIVNIVLKEEYILKKIGGRRVCGCCGASYNTCSVLNVSEGVDMPALLPGHGDPTKCDCGEPLERRADDAEDVARRRLDVYRTETEPLVEYYAAQGTLRTFTPLRGLGDVPVLFDLVDTALAEAGGVHQ